MNEMNTELQVREVIQRIDHQTTKQLIRKLMRQLKNSVAQRPIILNQIISVIVNILKNSNQHPNTKFKTYQLVMYLISMGDPDVYQVFTDQLFGIYRGNCLYNRNQPYKNKGEDFFKKNKYYVEANSSSEKDQIRKIGIQYIIFSLETVSSLAKWLPNDLNDQSLPSKFSLTYESLLKQGVDFPPQREFKYYRQKNADLIEQNIRQIQKEVYSTLYSGQKSSSIGQLHLHSNNFRTGSIGSMDKKSMNLGGNLVGLNSAGNIKQGNNDLQAERKQFEAELATQRKYFENQLNKQKNIHEQNIYQYEKKIDYLEQEMSRMRSKLTLIESRANVRSDFDRGVDETQKDRAIEDLQKMNQTLSAKVRQLQGVIKSDSQSRKYSKINLSQQSEEITKLKKENTSLKQKLLTQCQETSQFETKKHNKKNMNKAPQQLQFVGYRDARSCFEPFYSNSSSEIKIRLRKAILRQKQLLYRDKLLQIGCITKITQVNAVQLTIVFTNISQKPLFNFYVQFVTREDLSVKVLNNCRNYLQIGGQTKTQIYVTINQIDFRCLLCSLKYTAEAKQQKLALILPVSKLKLAQQLVYTPISNKKQYLKLEKVFKSDRKILPSIHKIKQYFGNALLQRDRTQHQTYLLKIQFLGAKFYLQIDEVGGQLRIAILYQHQKLAEAEKLLDELVFIFSKNY